MDLGARIRRIRLRQSRTLDSVAKQCGCTRSMISKIETGAASPAVAMLTRVAEALGVPVSSLLEDDSGKATIKEGAGGNGVKLTLTDKGYQFRALAASRGDKLMQPYYFVARKKDAKKDQRLSHPGEEFVYVLEGSMKYRVGSVEYTLGPGESLYFDAEAHHSIEPVTETVKYLGVFTERRAAVKEKK